MGGSLGLGSFPWLTLVLVSLENATFLAGSWLRDIVLFFTLTPARFTADASDLCPPIEVPLSLSDCLAPRPCPLSFVFGSALLGTLAVGGCVG